MLTKAELKEIEERTDRGLREGYIPADQPEDIDRLLSHIEELEERLRQAAVLEYVHTPQVLEGDK